MFAFPSPQKISQRLLIFFSSFYRTQLVVTLASIPLLAAWGLPVSTLSIVGNLIFSPLLVSFLIISIFVFFFSLFTPPPFFLCTLLESIVSAWGKISMHAGSWSYLYLPHHSWIVLLCLISLWYFLCRYSAYKKFHAKHSASSLTLLLALILTILTCWSRATHLLANSSVLKKNTGALLIFTLPGTMKIDMVDKGYFSRCASPESEAWYRLRPHLVAKHQTTHVRFLTLEKVSPRTVACLKSLENLCTIEKILLTKKIGKNVENDLKKWCDAHYITMEKKWQAKKSRPASLHSRKK